MNYWMLYGFQTRGRRVLPWLGMAVAAMALSACGRVVNRTAERRIRDSLRDVLGPAREYRVHIDSPPGRTVAGRLAAVTIDGDDVELSNGLLIDRLNLDLRDVDVDTRHGVVRGVGSARFTATIGEAALDEFLAVESPEDDPIRGIRISIGGRNVTISAERVVLKLGVPFQITGPLRLAGPHRVELDAAHLKVVGIPIAGKPLRFLKSRFESAVDLSCLPFPVSLTAVGTSPGSLAVSGTADIASYLRAAQERAPQ